MTKTFRKLLEPIRIGGVEIRNRIAMAPMQTTSLTNLDGSLNRRAIDYYIERAAGGVGLIITGAMKVENDVESLPLYCTPTVSRSAFPSLVELSEAVHALGSKLFVQLTAGDGRVSDPQFNIKPLVAPSAVPSYWDTSLTCRELKTEEVEYYVKRFEEAAQIVAETGVDGVEIHAVHEEYLLDQFTIAMFNRRTDKYGGDLLGRLIFPTEIVQQIKKRVGENFPVILRYSVKSFIKSWQKGGLPGEKFEEKGRDLQEGLEAAKILESAGYDAFDADCGSYAAWYWAHPPGYMDHGCYLPWVSELKKAVSVPVLVAGRMEIPELAEKAIAEGKVDMVSIGRGLLTDPYWVRKVEEGKSEHIRPCIGCHEGCMGRTALSGPLSCAVNPSAGREKIYRLESVSRPKKVMVVGGGIAGLEAARVAAVRKHNVTLCERSNGLGGHLIEASVPEFKKDLRRLLDWYKLELAHLQVDIGLGTEVTSSLIEKERPEVIIIATGSRSLIPNIPGVDMNKVVTDIDLFLGKKKAGGKVVVIGGGLIGCETALWLAQQGKKVTIIEQLSKLMMARRIPVPHMNKIMILDLLQFHKVETLMNCRPTEVTNQGITLIGGDFKTKTVEADTVVISVGLRPERQIYDELIGKVAHLYLIGDAREIGSVMGSVWDAFEVARVI